MAKQILFNFKAETRSAQRAFKRMKAGLVDVRRGYRQARRAASDLRRRNGSLLASFKGLTTGVAVMGKGLMGVASGPLNALNRAFGTVLSVGREVVGTLLKMALAGGALGTAIATKALSAFGSYERQMVRVRAITGASGEDWERIEKVIREVILTSEFMPGTIADAAQSLAALGVSTGAAFEKMLPAARAFATVLGIDINEAATILKATLNQFGLKTKDASDVVEVFANAWANSAADANKMADALKYVGFAAASSGQDLRDVTAVVMALVDRGLEASMAGTALRNVFSTLKKLKPGSEAAKSLQEAGIALDDVNLNARDLFEVMESLTKLSEDQFGEIFNVRGMDVAKVLAQIFRSAQGAGKSIGEYREALDQTGLVQRVLTDQAATLAQRWDVLKGSAHNLFIELGDAITRATTVKGSISSLSATVNEAAQDISRMSEESLKGLFSGIMSDVTSGRATEALKSYAKGLWELAQPVFEWLGANLGTALLRGISMVVAKAATYSPIALLFRAAGVSGDDMQQSLLDLQDWAGARAQWSGLDMGGAQGRAAKHFERGWEWLYTSRASGGRLLSEIDALEEEDRFRALHWHGARGSPVPPAPDYRPGEVQPPTYIDMRRMNVYRTGSGRDELRSKAGRLNPGTGKR
jgi:TP901 family phage tail tape measure protein